MQSLNKGKRLAALLVFSTSSVVFGQDFPFSLACIGNGSSGTNGISLHFENFLTGNGVVDGVPIVFTNMLSGGENTYNLVGWPRSQDTGNARDIKHKIEISIDRNTGYYNIKVTFVGSYSGVSSSASGICEKNANIKKF